jgi:hypothetical protein
LQKNLKSISKIIEDGLKTYPVKILVKDEYGHPVDPGECPVFLYMPTKL